MANVSVFESGWAQGAAPSQERRAHKQMMSDSQFQEKHNEIQGMIDNLGTKLAAVPEDQRNNPDYLKMQDQLAQAIQSRDAHWKSVDQPNALTKFGKMLGKDLRFKKQEAPTPVAPPVYGQPTIQTPASQGESVNLSAQPAQPASDRVDVVDGHLKASRDPGSPALPASTVSLGGSEAGPAIPTGPATKVQGPQTPAQMRAAAEASQLVAAGPLSPEQQATGKANATSAGDLATFNNNLKLYDQNHPEGIGPNATPEGKQARNEYVNELLTSGLKENKEKPEKWTDRGAPYANKDGEFVQLQVSPYGEQKEIAMPKDWKPAPLKQSSAFAAQLARALYGPNPTGQQMLDAVADYKEVSTPSKTSTAPVVLWDTENHPHIFEKTTTSKSTFKAPNVASIQGDEPVQSPAQDSPQADNMTPAPKTLSELRKEAAKLNAPPSSTPKTPKSPIGPALDFTKSTPASAVADKDVNTAVGLADAAHRAENAPMDVRAGLQRAVAAGIQNALEKRFNQAAFDNLIKHYGIANDFQAWIDKTETGALPDAIFKQLVAIADSNLLAKKAAQSSSRGESAGGGTTVQGETKEFKENDKIYDIPADKVEAFKKKHPNAKEQ